MFDNFIYSNLVFSFIASLFFITFILISYFKKIDFIFVLLSNIPLIIMLWIVDNTILPQILSLVFLVLATYFVVNKNKFISIKYFLYSLLSILVLILNKDLHLYYLSILSLLSLFLASEKGELDRIYPLCTIASVCFLISFLNLNHKIVDSNVALVLIIFLIVSLIKFIIVQKNFSAYFFIPFIAIASFINVYFIFFVILLFIFYLLLHHLKYNCSILSVFILIGTNIFIFSITNYIKLNQIAYFEYIQTIVFVVLTLSVAVYLETNKKYYYSFNHLIISVFGIALLYIPVFFINYNELAVFNLPLVASVVFLIINSLFFGIFRAIKIKSLSNMFQLSSYLKLQRSLAHINKKIIVLHYKLFKLIINKFKLFLSSLILYLKKLYLLIESFKHSLSSFCVNLISKFDSYMPRAEIEVIIFIVSTVVVIIILASEVI